MSSSTSRPQTWTADQLLTKIIDLCYRHGSVVLDTKMAGNYGGLSILTDHSYRWDSKLLLTLPTSSLPRTPSLNYSGSNEKESTLASLLSTILSSENMSDLAIEEARKTLTQSQKGMLWSLSSRLLSSSSTQESAQERSLNGGW